MLPSNPLQIQFCESTAQVWCADDELRQTIGRYFRYCLGDEPYPVVVTYRAEYDESWTLQRDNEFPRNAPSEFHIYMTLALDVVANLVNRCEHYTVFHAAGLAYQGQGLVMCGVSDSGKSTLAAWLTATGFDFLTDEMVSVSTQVDMIDGITCPLILREGSTFVWKKWLSAEAQEDFVHRFDGAVWIDPNHLRPNSVGSAVPPKLLLFPTYQAEANLTAHKIPKGDAIFRLMQRVINFANVDQRGFPQAKHLVQRCDCYELIYSDITEATAWIKKMLTH